MGGYSGVTGVMVGADAYEISLQLLAIRLMIETNITKVRNFMVFNFAPFFL
jgi:hypothetical protein